MIDMLVYIVAAFFLLMGLSALHNPVNITRFLSLTILPSDMRNEIRAVYGGFGVFMSTVLIASTRVSSIRDGVLLTVSMALLGMASGRIVSLAVDRTVGKYPYIFLGGELIMGGMLMYARASQ